MRTIQSNKKRRKLHVKRIVLSLLLGFGICAGTLAMMHHYMHPSLYGTWISEETNQSITFKKDGTVHLEEDTHTPVFELISDSRMYYTIDGKSFEMLYTINGRLLDWGTDKAYMERFRRK